MHIYCILWQIAEQKRIRLPTIQLSKYNVLATYRREHQHFRFLKPFSQVPYDQQQIVSIDHVHHLKNGLEDPDAKLQNTGRVTGGVLTTTTTPSAGMMTVSTLQYHTPGERPLFGPLIRCKIQYPVKHFRCKRRGIIRCLRTVQRSNRYSCPLLTFFLYLPFCPKQLFLRLSNLRRSRVAALLIY